MSHRNGLIHYQCTFELYTHAYKEDGVLGIKKDKETFFTLHYEQYKYTVKKFDNFKRLGYSLYVYYILT